MNCPDCQNHKEIFEDDVSHEMNKMVKDVTVYLKSQRITAEGVYVFIPAKSAFYHYDTVTKTGKEYPLHIAYEEIPEYQCMCGNTDVETCEVDEGVVGCYCPICKHEWDQEDE